MPLELLPWEKYWEEHADEDFMREDPDEANHPIRIRMFKEAEKVKKIMLELTPAHRRGHPDYYPIVMDVGCGTCIDYPRFKDNGYTYIGIEPIPKFIHRAMELYSDIRVEQMRIWNIGYEYRMADITWCKGVVQHLPPGTYPEALEELWRVTDKLMMISTNRLFWKGDRPNVCHREKGGPYDNHYNFKEFHDELLALPETVVKYTVGFIKQGEEERVKEHHVGAHTLFIVYRDDFWAEYRERLMN